MSAKAAAVAAVIAAVVAGAGAVAFLVLSEPPPEGETDVREATTERTVEPREVPEYGPRSIDPGLAPAPEGGAPWIEVPGYEDALRAIDWREVGARYAELVPRLEGYARSLARDPVPQAAETTPIAALWRELAELARPLRRVADYGPPNAVLVHPAFLFNSVPATLHARGRGLTVEQLAALREMVDSALFDEPDVDRSWREEETPFLGRVALICDVRRAFADRIHDLLDEGQRNALHPRELRWRVGLDPFGGVEVFRDGVVPVVYSETEEAAREVVALVEQDLPVDATRRDMGVNLISMKLSSGPLPPFPDGVRNMDRLGHVLHDTVIGAAHMTPLLVIDLRIAFAGGPDAVTPSRVLERPIILIRNP